MIETFTKKHRSLIDDEKQEETAMNLLTETEEQFYESIKPALNTLVKNPSTEVISRILAFSKSL